MRAMLVTLLAGAVGCGNSEFQCGEEGINANVSGEWLVRADGELEDCPEGASEGEVFLDVDVSLLVAQSPGNGAPDSLYLERAVTVDNGTFSFDGQVDGDCLDFTIQETGPGYDMTWVYEGDIAGNQIEGDFEATGSVFGSCVARGDFGITVLAPFAPRDGGSRDDGAPPADGAPPGDPAPGDGDVGPGDPRSDTECWRTEDCEEGACVDRRCVPMCDGPSDCRVGEKCEARRCVDASTGCNCNAGPGGAMVLALALFLCRPRGRSSK